MKKIFIVVILGFLCLVILWVVCNFTGNFIGRKTKDCDYESLKEYCQKQNLSENYAVIVDFSKPSGKHRLFVCDLKNNSIVSSSLCAHGTGKGSTARQPVFSNEIGSLCSSLGHYKITGKHRMNSSGLPSFKLVGLDKSNSNAERRGILIHSAKLISKFRWGIYPFCLPMDHRISSGCFAVDIDMMEVIGNLLEKERKPILLYATYKLN